MFKNWKQRFPTQTSPFVWPYHKVLNSKFPTLHAENCDQHADSKWSVFPEVSFIQFTCKLDCTYNQTYRNFQTKNTDHPARVVRHRHLWIIKKRDWRVQFLKLIFQPIIVSRYKELEDLRIWGANQVRCLSFKTRVFQVKWDKTQIFAAFGGLKSMFHKNFEKYAW